MSASNDRAAALIVDTGETMIHGAVDQDRIDRGARIAKVFQDVGIREIVIVTGGEEKQFRRSLSSYNLTFINAGENASQMFDFVKAGLSFLSGKCRRIFIAPLHIPFFAAETVCKELMCTESIVVPSYNGRGGHPLLIDEKYIAQILGYNGEGGLRGAIHSLGQPISYLPVSDAGTRMDAETVNEYLEIKRDHLATMLHLEIRIGIAMDRVFFDAGFAALLRQIDRLGSVREAAEKNGISYSKAWKLIGIAEELSGRQIVDRTHGGKYGGEARVTEDGLRMITEFDLMEQRISGYADSVFEEFRSHWL